ncbi:methyltransferase family protein [Aliiruegeria haliotis]|uniref:Methyltransferase family protein n=1 Tax=Aliiruegeria haliotis TaxID=1280846 RepID=A0A2T0RZB9_9RHOB|nr:class I SAM-dependent methyltransferase [Aliiruegeria haliotis]PRY26482.1 methyltransferase family protein [Aliiruegeria haliotis]
MAGWDDATIDWYAETHGEDASTRAVVDAAPFAMSDDVLDIGCGTGASLRYLAACGVTGRLAGVDPHARMVMHARRLSPDRIVFDIASAEALPFAPSCFDGLLAVNSVAHWSDRTAAFAEAFRVLRPGGWIAAGGEVFEELDGPLPIEDELQSAGFTQIGSTGIRGGRVTTARKGQS